MLMTDLLRRSVKVLHKLYFTTETTMVLRATDLNPRMAGLVAQARHPSRQQPALHVGPLLRGHVCNSSQQHATLSARQMHSTASLSASKDRPSTSHQSLPGTGHGQAAAAVHPGIPLQHPRDPPGIPSGSPESPRNPPGIPSGSPESPRNPPGIPGLPPQHLFEIVAPTPLGPPILVAPSLHETRPHQASPHPIHPQSSQSTTRPTPSARVRAALEATSSGHSHDEFLSSLEYAELARLRPVLQGADVKTSGELEETESMHCQGSDSWLRARQQRLTASSAGKATGLLPRCGINWLCS
jgi:hypothetical protein